MASILKVDEMQGVTSAGDITITGEGGSATQSLQQGLAKTWVVYEFSSGITTFDSFSVSSMTDGGTGLATVNFTNSYGNAHYAMAGCSSGGSGNSLFNNIQNTGSSKTTSACPMLSKLMVDASTNGAPHDITGGDGEHLVFHGDLA